jgi:hypothetical protein
MGSMPSARNALSAGRGVDRGSGAVIGNDRGSGAVMGIGTRSGAGSARANKSAVADFTAALCRPPVRRLHAFMN